MKDDTTLQRPHTRGECVNGPRPCPWVGCRHHLFLEVKRTGRIAYNFKEKDPSELATSCSLDVAEEGSHTLEQIGDIFGVSRERIRQIWAEIAPKLSRKFEDWS